MYSILGIQSIKGNGNISANQMARSQIHHDFRLGDCDFADVSKLEENRVLYLNDGLLSLPGGEKYEPFRYETRDKTPDIHFNDVFKRHIKEKCKPDFKVRKNAIYAIELMLTASSKRPANFDEAGWTRDSLKWVEDKFGKDNIVFAVLHRDETTPHIHVQIIPIVDGKLNASHFTGKMEKNRELNKSYFEAIKKYGFERRKKPLHKKKIPIAVFRERLQQEIDKSIPQPFTNETAIAYSRRIVDWIDNRRAEMFFDVNKERDCIYEEWRAAQERENDLDRRSWRISVEETKLKAKEAELEKYKSDHENMEALRESKRRGYLNEDECNLINRMIKLGRSFLKEMAERVFHPKDDTPKVESDETDRNDVQNDDHER